MSLRDHTVEFEMQSSFSTSKHSAKPDPTASREDGLLDDCEVSFSKANLELFPSPKSCTGYLYQRKWTVVLFLMIVWMTRLHIYVGLYLRETMAGFVPMDPQATDKLDHIVRMLPCMMQVLEKNEATWFMDEGSLLGAYRNKAIIPGDTDVDIALLTREAHKVPALIRDWEQMCNFYVVHRDHHREIFPFTLYTTRRVAMRIFSSYWGPNLYIDVRDYDVDQNGIIYDHHFVDVDDTYFIPVEDMLPTVPCEFSDLITQCPRNSLHVIEELYGSEWNIPKKGFKTTMLVRPTPKQLYEKAQERIKNQNYPRSQWHPVPEDVELASKK